LFIEDKVKDLNKGWHKATPSTPKRLTWRLIESMILTPESLKTHYVTVLRRVRGIYQFPAEYSPALQKIVK